MAKPIENNLTREQRQTLKEIKDDLDISIHPFDKWTGLIRLKTKDAIKKIREQIGDTDIVERDPLIHLLGTSETHNKKEKEDISPKKNIKKYTQVMRFLPGCMVK